MPYVSQESRKQLDLGTGPVTAGELNYVVSKAVDGYLRSQSRSGVDPRMRYEYLNTAIGVLACAQLELYRRVAVPYEDQKIEENGDVYRCLE